MRIVCEIGLDPNVVVEVILNWGLDPALDLDYVLCFILLNYLLHFDLLLSLLRVVFEKHVMELMPELWTKGPYVERKPFPLFPHSM
jgi:hypothetical protein